MTSRHQIPSARIVGTHQLAGSLDRDPGGTTTAVNEPANSSRASSSASLRSVFTRSEGPLGVLPGAITSIATPGSARGAIEPKPSRPGLIASAHRAAQTRKPRDWFLDARPEPGAQKLTR